MNTKTIPKKAWQTPQIFDLDVNNTMSGTATVANESSFTPPNSAICAPSS